MKGWSLGAGKSRPVLLCREEGGGSTCPQNTPWAPLPLLDVTLTKTGVL